LEFSAGFNLGPQNTILHSQGIMDQIKLTLRINAEVHEALKRQSQKTNTSIDEIAENIFRIYFNRNHPFTEDAKELKDISKNSLRARLIKYL
jgi:Family of unknown function (DUF6364)